jgi:hypothetical protein
VSKKKKRLVYGSFIPSSIAVWLLLAVALFNQANQFVCMNTLYHHHLNSQHA